MAVCSTGGRVFDRTPRVRYKARSSQYASLGSRLYALHPPGRRCRGAKVVSVLALRVPLPDVVAMQTRQPNLEGAGEIPLRRLVKEGAAHAALTEGCLDLS